MKPEQFLDILHLAEKLKNFTRHCVTSAGRPESVAEHSWRVALMAFILKDQFPNLDMTKVVDMCLIHDLGEAFTGDKPSFEKDESDTAQELFLFRQWIASLPQDLSVRMTRLIDEMEERKTPEALLYKSLDQMEAIIQHNESPISSWLPLEYELQQTYGHECCKSDSWLISLRQSILQDTLDKIRTEAPDVH